MNEDAYNKRMNAMAKASKLAHQMAFNLVYGNNKIDHQLVTIEDTDSTDEEIEFEINNEFVEFYKESLKYKLEKSWLELFFIY